MKNFILLGVFLPVFCAGQLGETYKSYLHGEFSDFFHTSEISRTSYKAGDLREIKTGAFQDFITIFIYTDTTTTSIHEATLEVDREWMEEDASAELSRDLVKSFLLDFIAKVDQSKAVAAGELLFNRKATQDKFALDLMEVFNNHKDSAFQNFTKSIITVENFKKEGKNYFRLKIAEPGT